MLRPPSFFVLGSPLTKRGFQSGKERCRTPGIWGAWFNSQRLPELESLIRSNLLEWALKIDRNPSPELVFA